MRSMQERLEGPEPEAWVPENEGELIFGEVEEVSRREGDFGEYTVVTLVDADGQVWNVAGFGTVLAGKLEDLDPQPGDKLGVKFAGEKTAKNGKAYKDWRVIIERSNAPVTVPASTTDPDFDNDDTI